MIKVLVVDDSALMRKLIPQILERDNMIQVVGTAMDGQFALKKIGDLRPDVVTLDLEMPRMDGMETLREIMKHYNLPVIIVSAHTKAGAAATFRALNIGAFDFVAKPRDVLSAQLEGIAQELSTKIRVAAASRKVKLVPAVAAAPPLRKVKLERRIAERAVAIGLSTGGPNALRYLLTQLPSEFPAAVLVVQHMPEGFTETLARRLNEECALDVKEAQSGDLLLSGRVLICPGNRHIKIRRMPLGNIAVLTDEATVNGHRPSVDVLFRSLAREFGPDGVAVLMTGMGEDGADGMGEVRARGGTTIAQNEESCVVYGMPRAAIERGHASRILPLESIPGVLLAQCSPARGGMVAVNG
jgi:two-component system, chemotaxis family, protein-glutamate methylesterase/glutaminase